MVLFVWYFIGLIVYVFVLSCHGFVCMVFHWFDCVVFHWFACVVFHWFDCVVFHWFDCGRFFPNYMYMYQCFLVRWFLVL